MGKCFVSGCLNRTVDHKRGVFNRPPKRFFSFPGDPARVKVWLAALREAELREAELEDSAEQQLICEDHFLPEDVSQDEVAGDAIPLMPAYLDGSLGLMSPRRGESSEDDRWWTAAGGDDDDDGGGDEGGKEAPAAAKPQQQDPGGGSENPPEDSSASCGQRDQPGHVTAADVPLDLLTRRFLQMLLAVPDGRLDLRQAASCLRAPLRRFDDITDVLDGISLVQKEPAGGIRWIGWSPISSFLWRNQKNLQSELDHLKLVESALDRLIRGSAHQLFKMTDNADNAASAYVTFEDIRRLQDCEDQMAIIIKAPQETKLDIPPPKEDSVQLRLKAVEGPIAVVTCEPGSAVAVISDPAERRRRRRRSFFLPLEESRVRMSRLRSESSGPQSAVQTT
ncbi:transcription factor E2F3-like [Brachyistius frenatus]|uniref:transcription factor E2F3-like n=1 Tax=Brachyistius frenatus TaxID=100188 RepID=UPI0037E87487